MPSDAAAPFVGDRSWGAAAMAAALLIAAPAAAGPPFRTDDPEPVELGHWEIYEFSTATHATGDTAGVLSGIDANYGAAPELQLETSNNRAVEEKQTD